MDPLATLTMVKLFSQGASTEESDSREVEGLLTKILNYLNLDGLGFLVRLSPSVNELIAYWRQYAPIEAHKDLLVHVRGVMRALCDESYDYVARVSELCLLFDIKLTRDEKRHEFDKFLTIGLFGGRIVKEWKYTVNKLFSFYFGTDPPRKSYADMCGMAIFPRRLRVLLQRTVGRKSERERCRMEVCSQIYTIFQGFKKGLLPIRPDAVDQSLVDHQQALAYKDPVIDEKTLQELEEILKEDFPDLPKEVRKAAKRTSRGSLSSKATVESSMSDQGQIGFARRLFLTPERVGRVVGDLQNVLDYWEGRIVFHSTDFAGFARSGCRTSPLYYDGILSDSEVIETLKQFYQSRANPREFVMPSIVLEPFKARIITKPQVGAYIGMNQIQKGMWSYLQRFRQFALSGRPVCEEDIWYVAGSWVFGKQFNSGDFTGATDNLKGVLSRMILEFSLKGLEADDPFLYERCRTTFLESKIVYKKPNMSSGLGPFYREWRCTQMKNEDYAQQQNGQLMGHVLSFPLLCVANWLIFRLVYKRLERETPNCLVNGDDILFCAYPEEYTLWQRLTTECGLYPSVGKNLFSDKVAQINSVLYRVQYASLDPTNSYNEDTGLEIVEFEPAPRCKWLPSFIRKIEEVPYVNFGLLTMRGKNRLGGSDVQRVGMEAFGSDDLDMGDEAGFLPCLSSVWNALDCGATRKKKALRKIFYDNHKGTLDILYSRTGFNFFSQQRPPDQFFDHLSMVKDDIDLRSVVASRVSTSRVAPKDRNILCCLGRETRRFTRSNPFAYIGNVYDLPNWEIEKEDWIPDVQV